LCLCSSKQAPGGLPDLTQYLAAQVALSGLPIGNNAPAGADDRYTQSIEDRFQFRRSVVEPPPRLGDAANMPDHPFSVRPVLQVQPQLRKLLHLDFAEVPDVAFALQHLGQAALDL